MGDVNLVAFLLAKRILLFIGAGRFWLVGEGYCSNGGFWIFGEHQNSSGNWCWVGEGGKEITKDRLSLLFCLIYFKFWCLYGFAKPFICIFVCFIAPIVIVWSTRKKWPLPPENAARGLTLQDFFFLQALHRAWGIHSLVAIASLSKEL